MRLVLACRFFAIALLAASPFFHPPSAYAQNFTWQGRSATAGAGQAGGNLQDSVAILCIAQRAHAKNSAASCMRDAKARYDAEYAKQVEALKKKWEACKLVELAANPSPPQSNPVVGGSPGFGGFGNSQGFGMGAAPLPVPEKPIRVAGVGCPSPLPSLDVFIARELSFPPYANLDIGLRFSMAACVAQFEEDLKAASTTCSAVEGLSANSEGQCAARKTTTQLCNSICNNVECGCDIGFSIPDFCSDTKSEIAFARRPSTRPSAVNMSPMGTNFFVRKRPNFGDQQKPPIQTESTASRYGIPLDCADGATAILNEAQACMQAAKSKYEKAIDETRKVYEYVWASCRGGDISFLSETMQFWVRFAKGGNGGLECQLIIEQRISLTKYVADNVYNTLPYIEQTLNSSLEQCDLSMKEKLANSSNYCKNGEKQNANAQTNNVILSYCGIMNAAKDVCRKTCSLAQCDCDKVFESPFFCEEEYLSLASSAGAGTTEPNASSPGTSQYSEGSASSGVEQTPIPATIAPPTVGVRSAGDECSRIVNVAMNEFEMCARAVKSEYDKRIADKIQEWSRFWEGCRSLLQAGYSDSTRKFFMNNHEKQYGNYCSLTNRPLDQFLILMIEEDTSDSRFGRDMGMIQCRRELDNNLLPAQTCVGQSQTVGSRDVDCEAIKTARKICDKLCLPGQCRCEIDFMLPAYCTPSPSRVSISPGAQTCETATGAFVSCLSWCKRSGADGPFDVECVQRCEVWSRVGLYCNPYGLFPRPLAISMPAGVKGPMMFSTAARPASVTAPAGTGADAKPLPPNPCRDEQGCRPFSGSPGVESGGSTRTERDKQSPDANRDDASKRSSGFSSSARPDSGSRSGGSSDVISPRARDEIRIDRGETMRNRGGSDRIK